jgi:hypothetical protein
MKAFGESVVKLKTGWERGLSPAGNVNYIAGGLSLHLHRTSFLDIKILITPAQFDMKKPIQKELNFPSEIQLKIVNIISVLNDCVL